MSKEVYLKKAYDAATINDVVRHGDDDVSFLVIKDSMIEYAKKNNVEVSVEEIEAYIKKQQQILDESTSDFKIQTKMMN